jgi:hypothetical protein
MLLLSLGDSKVFLELKDAVDHSAVRFGEFDVGNSEMLQLERPQVRSPTLYPATAFCFLYLDSRVFMLLVRS